MPLTESQTPLLKTLVVLSLLLTGYAFAASKFRVLHDFQCNPSGCFPYGGLVIDSGGILYGTTPGGGGADATIFRMKSLSGRRWDYSRLYTLTIGQGSAIVAALALDSSSNLYGTSMNGGSQDLGSVFKLSRDPRVATGWSLEVLHSFVGVGDGIGPWDKVVFDQSGNI